MSVPHLEPILGCEPVCRVNLVVPVVVGVVVVVDVAEVGVAGVRGLWFPPKNNSLLKNHSSFPIFTRYPSSSDSIPFVGLDTKKGLEGSSASTRALMVSTYSSR